PGCGRGNHIALDCPRSAGQFLDFLSKLGLLAHQPRFFSGAHRHTSGGPGRRVRMVPVESRAAGIPPPGPTGTDFSSGLLGPSGIRLWPAVDFAQESDRHSRRLAGLADYLLIDASGLAVAQ